MDDLIIYISRLKEDTSIPIDAAIEPSYFRMDEKELMLTGAVHIRADAYRTDSHLIVDLTISATVEIPCNICNTFFATPIQIPALRHTVPLTTIPDQTYDLTDEIRNQILLMVPHFGECQGGVCSERRALQPYLHTKKNLPFSKFNL